MSRTVVKPDSKSTAPAPGFARRWARILRDAGAGWWRKRATLWSAALAFYTLFSLAPTLLIATKVAGAILGESAVDGRLDRELEGVWGSAAADFVADLMRRTRLQQSGWLPTATGVVLVLYGATIAFNTLRQAIDALWEIEPDGSRFVRTALVDRALGLVVALLVGIMLLLSVVASTVLAAASEWIDQRTNLHFGLQMIGDGVTTLALFALLFTVLLKILPNVALSWLDVLPGAVITAVLFAGGKLALSLYLGRAAISSTYGAAGALVVILIWTYYSAQILLFGAEVVRAQVEMRQQPKLKPGYRRTRVSGSAGRPS